MKTTLKHIMGIVGLAAIVFLMPAGVGHALAPRVSAGITVTPASSDWAFYDDNSVAGWSTGFHNGPGTPPIGVGSAFITLSSSGAGVILGTQKYQGTKLSDIQALEYSTYTNLSPAAMAFQINYDPDVTTVEASTWYGRLIYEPYINGTVTNGTWQTWDMIDGGSGKWWASPNGNSTVDDTCPQASPCTWSALIAAFPNIGIRNDALSMILFKAGSNWNGFNGSVDNLSITIGGNTDTYNFELPADVYVNASWAGTSNGTDPDGAGPATSFGADAFDTIQAGVNAVALGGTVHVAAGTYVENITITTPLTLAGANQATTIIKPAVSNPNCSGGGSGSLCTGGTAASTVILVQADNVIIHHFTIDGDNPGLTSGIVVGGADLDARNGIITNHDAGVYNGLEVHHVTVQNIYLRGMYASSGGTFNFHDNTVTNVRANPASIGMFAYGGGPGYMENNTVTFANDGISANHSKGIQFLNNTVSNSGSGVHTDNAGDGGGVADLIQGNTISNCDTANGGYGIFVFVPYIAPTVNNNTITNCKFGLSAWGQGAAVTTAFTNNTVNGSGLAGSIGARISTDLTDIYDAIFMDVSVNFSGNIITGNDTGVYLNQSSGHTLTATFHGNQISGNLDGVDTGGVSGTLITDFLHNWWGSMLGPLATDNPAGKGDHVVAGITTSPWCINAACTLFGPPIKFDDADAGWTYGGGWVSFPVTGAFDNTLHIGAVPGVAATYSFDAAPGSRFILTYLTFPNWGKIGVYLDGSATPLTTLDTNAAAGLSTYMSPPLSPGSHTLTLKNAGPSGKLVAIDALEITLPTYYGAGTYDDGHAGWTYQGGWVGMPIPGAYNNTLTIGVTAGSTASFSFNGSRLALTYLQFPGWGNFELYLDGNSTPFATVSTNGPAGLPGVLSSPLAAGPHTVMVKYTGPASAFIALDDILIMP